MTTAIERLQTALDTLGLKAVEARLESLLEQASKKEPSCADFLEESLSCEVEARRSRYLRARLQLAHLPFVKTFEQFDFSFQPSIDERQIRELRSLRFIDEASNVIFLGPPGVGKTHLSVALAEAAIQSGFGAYFITAHDLATDLGKAYREGRLDRRMRIYLAPKVLVIDELGYLPLGDLGTPIFFQLVSGRYERGSIILTSNKSYGDWGSILGEGQLRRSKKLLSLRGLNANHNHDLKNIFKGAATMASARPGPFRDFYTALLAKGMKPTMARLTLARKIAAITLILWKKGERFDAEQLKRQAA